MRINIHGKELTDEVQTTVKISSKGVGEQGVQLMLRSALSEDDRASITFWMPDSKEERERMAAAFDKIAELFRD